MPTTPMISIIDDDASVRTATDNLLRSFGYGVLTFGSADEFLQSGVLDQTACVIADVNMPGTNGVELLLRLRARGNEIPFIFITAFPEAAVSAHAASAGAVCLLTKPFETDNLIQNLEQALQGRDGQGPTVKI
ncbi:response regulator transcription factor [Bradyrhizobium neotropicale]|uniref:response regulator transcription factor n=1 Tax=Bradyrhizobium neotropicale TaxID=1497615 RepID=UPI001FEFA930|nr:response regulator [Bradyrhizobium neotropicale]MBO4226729.1 response regulator [Bradyrhizobium neotropicale]